MTTIAFSIYIILVAAISWWAYRKTQATEDYFLGGRQLSPTTAALSAGASDMSGWLLLGLPGYALASGLESLWLSAGLCTGLALCWFSVAARLRVYTELLDNALTVPTYLQRRFADQSPALRLVPAFFILLFFLFYVSSGFVAGGKLFSTVFSSSYSTGIWLTFAFVVLYTLVGGFLAVSWTDVLQGLLMLLALLIAPMMVIVSSGGLDASIYQISDINEALFNPFTSSAGEPLGWVAIVGLLGWGLGYFGQPHILARFKAIRSDREIPKAASIAVAWSVLVNMGAICVGLFAVVIFHGEHALKDSEHVFMVLANTLFHPLIAGVLMAAILAAIMSTADSQLLVCSSAFAEDIMGFFDFDQQGWLKPIVLGRCAVIVIGFFALLFALDPENKVLDVVSYAWAGLGAAFGPVIITSLYCANMTRLSALVGIVVGALTVVIWKPLSGGIFDLFELVPGFLFSFTAILLVNHFYRDTGEVHQQYLRFSKHLATGSDLTPPSQ